MPLYYHCENSNPVLPQHLNVSDCTVSMHMYEIFFVSSFRFYCEKIQGDRIQVLALNMNGCVDIISFGVTAEFGDTPAVEGLNGRSLSDVSADDERPKP